MFEEKLIKQLTGISIVILSIIFYVLGYLMKITALLNDVLSNVIEFSIARNITAFLIAIPASLILLVVSIHAEKKWKKYLLAFFDCLLLIIILRAFDNVNFSELATISEFINFGKRIFIPVLLSTMFFFLIEVFKKLKEQKITKSMQNLTNVKQTTSEVELKLNELKTTFSSIQGIISEHRKLTCPDCQMTFHNQNAMNAHKCKGQNESSELIFLMDKAGELNITSETESIS
ncbi:hypothetical protein SAMN04489761_1155 [Tenacibaculum sp. MAR_2009_124]|uniref:hypothetical protein n=1 Tax=Tenacibaculum sp. MAR_2009_124 TaxID=1250059 RepID=UPI000898D4A9|nr:hypothetical protein [Tenacibaculum sp. MAR_2009_124]SEB51535.1 hypothetical protein SAMN04489761_1155 [Tenacibaculum sp. MAR_2009_124]